MRSKGEPESTAGEAVLCWVFACPFTGISAEGGLRPVLQHGLANGIRRFFSRFPPVPAAAEGGGGHGRETGGASSS